MPAFAIHTLGCKVNTYESDLISQQMRNSGFSEVDFTETADVYIINTCTVTNIADRKSRQMLHRARKMNPDALIIAAGCYVDSVEQGKGLPETEVDLWVPNREKNVLAKRCLELLKYGKKRRDREERNGGPFQSAVPGCAYDEMKADERCSYPEGEFLTELDGHTRAFVKIEDGCNMFCSYCIIPYVRGRVAVRPAEDTVKEVRELAKRGVREVVLTGIHLSSMGKQLLRTVEELNQTEGILRIRLGSLEPRFVTEEAVERLAACEKLCPHFHLSLQSGSDAVLKRMKRRYTSGEFLQVCGRIRRAWPQAALTTDIIVGFPGETEAEFEESLAFAEKAGFYEAHVFKYSRRKGTAADRMKEQLPESVKSERSSRLIAAAEKLSSEYRRRFLGQEAELLAEERIQWNGESYITGYSREYVRCMIPEGAQLWKPGDLLRGKACELVYGPGQEEILRCGKEP